MPGIDDLTDTIHDAPGCDHVVNGARHVNAIEHAKDCRRCCKKLALAADEWHNAREEEAG